MIIIPTGRPLLAVACPLFVLQQYVYSELPILEELIARVCLASSCHLWPDKLDSLQHHTRAGTSSFIAI